MVNENKAFIKITVA